MAPLPDAAAASTPRQKSSVLGLLRWLREKVPYFADVLLKDYVEDAGEVFVFVVMRKTLAAAFEAELGPKLVRRADPIDELRRLAMETVLRKAMVDAPPLLDVELTAPDYAREEFEEFAPGDGPLVLPWGLFLTFKLVRKVVEKNGKATSTADSPDSDAGGPGYVVRAYHPLTDEENIAASLKAGGLDKADFDPDWLLWKPRPSKDDRVARLLEETCKLIRPSWPKLEAVAEALRNAPPPGHTTLNGMEIDADNVRRIVISAELLLGNLWPDPTP